MATISPSSVDLDAVNYARAPRNPRLLVVVPIAADVYALAYQDDGADLCGIRDRAPFSAMRQWMLDSRQAGLDVLFLPVTDPGPDGQRQTVLQGCAKASGAEIAKRRASMPLQAKTAQRACDVGLFSDDAAQIDLCEMFQDSTEEETTE